MAAWRAVFWEWHIAAAATLRYGSHVPGRSNGCGAVEIQAGRVSWMRTVDAVRVDSHVLTTGEAPGAWRH